MTNEEYRLDNWMKEGKYLPEFMRDFHDQKKIFKDMHRLYEANDNEFRPPSWVAGHVYTIDWFLWYMGRRGYTLQKNRSSLEFDVLP